MARIIYAKFTLPIINTTALKAWLRLKSAPEIPNASIQVNVSWQMLPKPRGRDPTNFGGVLRRLVVRQHMTPTGFAHSPQGRMVCPGIPSLISVSLESLLTIQKINF